MGVIQAQAPAPIGISGLLVFVLGLQERDGIYDTDFNLYALNFSYGMFE